MEQCACNKALLHVCGQDPVLAGLHYHCLGGPRLYSYVGSGPETDTAAGFQWNIFLEGCREPYRGSDLGMKARSRKTKARGAKQ